METPTPTVKGLALEAHTRFWTKVGARLFGSWFVLAFIVGVSEYTHYTGDVFTGLLLFILFEGYGLYTLNEYRLGDRGPLSYCRYIPALVQAITIGSMFHRHLILDDTLLNVATGGVVVVSALWSVGVTRNLEKAIALPLMTAEEIVDEDLQRVETSMRLETKKRQSRVRQAQLERDNVIEEYNALVGPVGDAEYHCGGCGDSSSVNNYNVQQRWSPGNEKCEDCNTLDKEVEDYKKQMPTVANVEAADYKKRVAKAVRLDSEGQPEAVSPRKCLCTVCGAEIPSNSFNVQQRWNKGKEKCKICRTAA